MEAKIIKIGNSKGLRLSKLILEKYDIKDKVYLRLEKDSIIIEPIKQPRANWSKAFQNMHKHGDDQLLIDDVFEDEVSWA